MPTPTRRARTGRAEDGVAPRRSGRAVDRAAAAAGASRAAAGEASSNGDAAAESDDDASIAAEVSAAQPDGNGRANRPRPTGPRSETRRRRDGAAPRGSTSRAIRTLPSLSPEVIQEAAADQAANGSRPMPSSRVRRRAAMPEETASRSSTAMLAVNRRSERAAAAEAGGTGARSRPSRARRQAPSPIRQTPIAMRDRLGRGCRDGR